MICGDDFDKGINGIDNVRSNFSDRQNMFFLCHCDDDIVHYICMKIGQFLQVRIGIFANTFLLLFDIFMLILDHRPKPTVLIMYHLVFVHIMKLFTALFFNVYRPV